MKKDRLLKLLISLNSKELKGLEEIVHSPFFNKDKKCIALFEAIKEYAPDFELTAEIKDGIAQQIVPSKKWNDASVSFLRSRLIKLINELFVFQELQERRDYKSHLLIKALLKHQNNNYALSIYNEVNNLNKNRIKTDVDFYYEQFLIEEKFTEYLELEKGRTSRSNLVKLHQSLDTYYIARKLNLSAEILSTKQIIGIDYDDEILHNIEHLITLPKYQENNFIKLYYFVLQILKDEENEDAYHSFVELLDSSISKTFYISDINIFYTHAINYCIKRIKKGRKEFKQHLFSIYLALIDNRLIYDGNYILVNRMKNIISISCQLGKIDWAKQFLDHYQRDLNPKIKESSTQMFKAFICFYNKDYKGTLFELAQIQSDIDALFFLNIRTFQLRCYYELFESEAFHSLYKTFRDYLRRTKKEIATSKKQSHASFNRIAYMLFRKKEGFSSKSSTDIRHKIEETKPLELKSWLLEKCNELDN